MHDTVMLMLRILCQCASTMMILSPTPTVYRIYRTKDVGVASVLPLVAVLGNSYSWCVCVCAYVCALESRESVWALQHASSGQAGS